MSNGVNIEIRFGAGGAMIAVEEGGVANDEQAVPGNRPGAGGTSPDMPQYDTETLFAGWREIIVHHAGAAYRMKITRQGKLILNK
jgi:hemin uptake protein HemP